MVTKEKKNGNERAADQVNQTAHVTHSPSPGDNSPVSNREGDAPSSPSHDTQERTLAEEDAGQIAEKDVSVSGSRGESREENVEGGGTKTPARAVKTQSIGESRRGSAHTRDNVASSSGSNINMDVLDLRRARQQDYEAERLSQMIARHERQQKESEKLKEMKKQAAKAVKRSVLSVSSRGHHKSTEALPSPAASNSMQEDSVISIPESTVSDREDRRTELEEGSMSDVREKRKSISRPTSDKDGNVLDMGSTKRSSAQMRNEGDEQDSTERDISDEQTEEDSISVTNLMLPLKVVFKELQFSVNKFFRNLEWHQRYYFYMHLAAIVTISFFGGILIWISENYIVPSPNRPYLTFIDAWFTSVSANCVTGLIVIDFSLISSLGQVIVICLILLGSLTLTNIPALIIKIIRARNRMLIRRKQISFADFDELHRIALEEEAQKILSIAEPTTTQQQQQQQTIGSSSLSNQQTQDTRPSILGTDKYFRKDDEDAIVVEAPPEEEETPVRATFDVRFNSMEEDVPIRKTYDVERRRTVVPDMGTGNLDDIDEKGTTHGSGGSRPRRRWKKPEQDFNLKMSRKQRKGIQDILSYRPPPATDIEFLALRAILIIVIATVISITSFGFFILSFIFQFAYSSEALDNRNPWWLGFFLAISGFNNVGLVPFPDNLGRFISDPFICLTFAFLIMSGNTCFPGIIRFIVYMLFRFGPKRHKLIYKYLLLNHHHLIHHLYPSLQTRVYLLTTFSLLGIGTLIAITLDFWGEEMHELSVGTRILVVVFHTISTRAAGFGTFDVSVWGQGTLLFYMIMMRIKPQMACALHERAYGITEVIGKFYTSPEKQLLREIQKRTLTPNVVEIGPKTHAGLENHEQKVNEQPQSYTPSSRSARTSIDSDVRRTSARDLQRQQTETSDSPHAGAVADNPHDEILPEDVVRPSPSLERKRVEQNEVNDIIDDILDYGNADETGASDDESMTNDLEGGMKILEALRRFKKQLSIFFQSIVLHIRNLFLANNVWIFFFMLAICILENGKMRDDPINFNFFRVAFEVISAFGNVGMSLGYVGLHTSFSGAFSNTSKLLIMVTIIFGRHRGLYGSMKDQEYKDFTSRDIMSWWYEERKEQLQKEHERHLQRQQNQVDWELREVRVSSSTTPS